MKHAALLVFFILALGLSTRAQQPVVITNMESGEKRDAAAAATLRAADSRGPSTGPGIRRYAQHAHPSPLARGRGCRRASFRHSSRPTGGPRSRSLIALLGLPAEGGARQRPSDAVQPFASTAARSPSA